MDFIWSRKGISFAINFIVAYFSATSLVIARNWDHWATSCIKSLMNEPDPKATSLSAHTHISRCNPGQKILPITRTPARNESEQLKPGNTRICPL